MPSNPIFYDVNKAGLSTERSFFEGLAEIDLEGQLKASEEDRRQKDAVIEEILADRDAWIGYFKQLEVDRDGWTTRYESVRAQIIACEHDTPTRHHLVRLLIEEREANERAAAEAQSRG